jgi:hypothetical protein
MCHPLSKTSVYCSDVHGSGILTGGGESEGFELPNSRNDSPLGGPVAKTGRVKMGGATYYLNYDQVAFLRLVADASGNVVKRVSCGSIAKFLNGPIMIRISVKSCDDT